MKYILYHVVVKKSEVPIHIQVVVKRKYKLSMILKIEIILKYYVSTTGLS